METKKRRREKTENGQHETLLTQLGIPNPKGGDITPEEAHALMLNKLEELLENRGNTLSSFLSSSIQSLICFTSAIPSEVWWNIFRFLNSKLDLVHSSQVCKEWHEWMNEDAFWQNFIEGRWSVNVDAETSSSYFLDQARKYVFQRLAHETEWQTRSELLKTKLPTSPLPAQIIPTNSLVELEGKRWIHISTDIHIYSLNSFYCAKFTLDIEAYLRHYEVHQYKVSLLFHHEDGIAKGMLGMDQTPSGWMNGRFWEKLKNSLGLSEKFENYEDFLPFLLSFTPIGDDISNKMRLIPNANETTYFEFQIVDYNLGLISWLTGFLSE